MKTIPHILSKIYYLFAFWVIFSCSSPSNADDVQTQENKVLIDAKLVKSYTAKELQEKASSNLFTQQVRNIIKYDVDVYKMNFKSTYKEKEITESALVAIAKEDAGNLPIVSYQHGTITSSSEVPSIQGQNPNTLSEGFVSIVFASIGYAAIAPDYVGFGSSEKYAHPYLVKEVNNQTIHNAITALYDYLKNELKRESNGKLYLTGYSQGGYATVAAHQYIEENAIPGLNLQNSYAGGGVYDLNFIKKDIINREQYPAPYFLAYAFNAYVNHYDMNTNQYSKVYKSQYTEAVSNSFDGSLSGSQINDKLNLQTDLLYTTNFIDNNETDTQFDQINKLLTDNSISAWDIKSKLNLYHGEDDELITVNSTSNFYQEFVDKSKSQLVSYKKLSNELVGSSHSISSLLFLLDISKELEKNKK